MRTSRGADILRAMLVAMLAALAVAPARAVPSAPLRFDAATPPVQVGTRDGWPVVRFLHGDGAAVDLPVSDGAVFRLAPGAPVPEGAVWLGGPSWRMRSASPIATSQALAGHPGVLGVFPDVLLPQARAGDGTYDDPSRGSQWWVDRLSMDRLWAVSPGDAAVRVAVIDSAIDIGHPDLATAVAEPYDAIDDDDDPSPGAPCDEALDCDLHGTAVAGAALARGGNDVGIVGMCPACTLVPIRLLGEDDAGTPLSADVRAFEHAIASGAGVINNSWGFTESIPAPEPLAEVIARATTEGRDGLGALVVFAAGNDDRRIRPVELAALEDVLRVSATDSYGYPTNYTNAGAAVDVAAPSATVSVVPGGGVITTFGGTSAAAPVVSGLAGWALSQDPSMTAAELRALLEGTAAPSASVPPDADGRNDVYGRGVIDPVAILETLYPPSEEGAAGCACGLSPAWGGGGHPLRNASPAALGLLAALLRRGRRA